MQANRVLAVWEVLHALNTNLGVWTGRLPSHLRASMPGEAIIVRGSAGGSAIATGRYLDLDDGNVDIRCYGFNEDSAMQVALAVRAMLQETREQATGAGVLHWCQAVSASSQLREGDAEWPLVLMVWRAFVTEG